VSISTTSRGAAGAGAARQVCPEPRDRRQPLCGRLGNQPFDGFADRREVEQGPLDAGGAQPATDHHFVALEGH
jgi:hypothetical protein